MIILDPNIELGLTLYKDKLMSKEVVRESGMVRSMRIPEKTFGFITTPTGDRFFHWSEFQRDSDKPFHHLKMGDVVTFEVATSDEGKPIAKNVHFKYAVDTRKKK